MVDEKEISEVVDSNKLIDLLEARLAGEYPAVACPLTHIFTPGLYTRQIFMPAGTLVTSKIHKTEHPYIISQGIVSVLSENDGKQLLEAPFIGVTKPNTRRILYCHTDVIWTTSHVLAKEGETLEEIEARIIEPHDNTEMLKEFLETNSFLIE